MTRTDDVDTGEALALARQLIEHPSLTPDDAGCQALLAARLAACRFSTEMMRFGAVENLWARHGETRPVLCFAGHTDVVPPGPLEAWTSPPFEPAERGGLLFGRGAADMKGGLAAAVIACESFARRHRSHKGTLALLVTSDEEGPAQDGTRRVLEVLAGRGQQIDWCVVGEPSSLERLGDNARIGRRGSLNGHLSVRGRQGHVAYPATVDNPVHRFAPALVALLEETWDGGSECFPSTSLQISNAAAGTGALNVTPATLEVDFNFRFSPAVTADALRGRVEDIFRAHGLNALLRWELSAEPFLTRDGRLREAVRQAVRETLGEEPDFSAGGGTSDGRFFASRDAEVVELGPVNASIHSIDEHVRIADLGPLSRAYLRIMELLLL